jgi:hypothetical protein
MISQGEDSVLLVRAFISRMDRNGWLSDLDVIVKEESPAPDEGVGDSAILVLSTQR